jgi:hypothetical protein
MYIVDHFDKDRAQTGAASLNIVFADAPGHTHRGVFHDTCTREQMCAMLRELAMHIEYNVGMRYH